MPGVSTLGTFTHDSLLAGYQKPGISQAAVLLSGRSLSRGTLLGKVTKAAGDITAGTNSGGGTCTLFSIGKNAIIGNYVAKCTATGTNAGTFSVVDPNGNRLKDAAASAAGVAYASDHINFTLTDVGTDFAVGDQFTLAVVAGSGKLVGAELDLVNGAMVPFGILAEACNATSADKPCVVYREGEFNEEKVVLVDTNDTVALYRSLCESVGIIFRAPVKAGS
jgi:hypothetical protein